MDQEERQLSALQTLSSLCRVMLADDEVCEFLKTRQLDEDVTMYSCLEYGIAELNDSGLGAL